MININNKRWEDITAEDLKELLSSNDDETFFIEYKSDEEPPAKLVKEVSAFANTYGGYVFLGINDDKTIGGCEKWTEQRIHTTIHDSLTPSPNFDVRKIAINNKVVLAIKVEEGPIPPYITGKGAIFERLSSGSFPVKDSAKLNQLYNKRIDQKNRVKETIEYDDLSLSSGVPNNLCGYIDLGFFLTCSERTYLSKNLRLLDYETIAKRNSSNKFSISIVGNSVMVTIGQMEQDGEIVDNYLYQAGLHNYMIIHDDCSVNCRMLLFAKEDTNYVNIINPFLLSGLYIDFYKSICGSDLNQIFIHAQKYESLRVLKQFVPVYDTASNFRSTQTNPFSGMLANHRSKYGENLIVQGIRIPASGYQLIDKRWFNTIGIDYNQENLVDELFHSSFVHLGYIDNLKPEDYEKNE